jgi:putative FmdB family regulatory protein
MPTYEYECTACKHRFEQFQKFSDPPVDTCPECGSAVRRVIFPAGIVFKGSGWYITDSRKSPPSESSAADAKTETKGDGKTDTKGESGAKSEPAPAAKSDTASTAASSPSPAKASTATKATKAP